MGVKSIEPFDYKKARDLDLPRAERAGDIRRESGHVDALVHPLVGALLRPWMAVMHRLKVVGREHLPDKPPYILVANHTSHLDTPALLSCLPRKVRSKAYPVAAHDTFFTTRTRALVATKLLNILPVRRQRADRHALDTLRARVIEDEAVLILFPEGTRGDGRAVERFKPGVGMLVAGTSIPVVPCRLRGCEAAMPKGRWLPKPTPLSLRIGEPMRFEEVSQDKQGWQAVAERLRSAVEGL